METTSLENNNTGTNYIAFFDLDRTIISLNSGKVFVKHAFKQGLMKVSDLIKAFFLLILYSLKLIDSTKIISSVVNWLKGVPVETIDLMTSEIFTDYLLESIHGDVITEISMHKKNGARVVILSSSIPPVCWKIAEHLGMDDVICSRLEVVNGIFSGQPDGTFCFGKEKANRLIDYCEKYNVNHYDSWYYADSTDDIPALSIVAKPVCINPDMRLRKEALRHKWTILTWD